MLPLDSPLLLLLLVAWRLRLYTRCCGLCITLVLHLLVAAVDSYVVVAAGYVNGVDDTGVAGCVDYAVVVGVVVSFVVVVVVCSVVVVVVVVYVVAGCCDDVGLRCGCFATVAVDIRVRYVAGVDRVTFVVIDGFVFACAVVVRVRYVVVGAIFVVFLSGV